MEMHYIGPLLGRSARITFHEFVTECSYSIKEPLHKFPTHVLAHACRVRQHPGLCSNLILA